MFDTISKSDGLRRWLNPTYNSNMHVPERSSVGFFPLFNSFYGDSFICSVN